ncbi:MAG: S9 family peptidase [Cyclobacteriaceae bacterium]|nr:S9 family peptidase [Cyclobacteriaceae bacterium]
MEYPETYYSDKTHTWFGTEVPDPFFWLEDDRSAETKAWIKAQNIITQNYLSEIPFRSKIRNRIEQLYNYERYGAPGREGDHYYFSKNDGLQNQSVIYVQNSIEEESAEVFLDPNTFSEDGTSSLGSLDFSRDGSFLAYSISEGGSDWRKVLVMDVKSQKIVSDTLHDIKFSGIAWYKNEGFYYSSYDKPKEGSDLSGITQYHKVYYHKLGASQKDDQLIFGGEQMPRRYIFATVTDDDRYLILSAAQGTSGNQLFIKDLWKKNAEFIQMVDNFENDHSVVYTNGDELYIFTNDKAPKGRLVKVKASDPHQKNWMEFIPESELVLQSVSSGGDQIFLSYMRDASSEIIHIDNTGNTIRKIALPGFGTASGFSGKRKDKEVFYYFNSFNYPTAIFRYRIEDGYTEIFRKSELAFESELYEVKQEFFTSKDGTKVPMFIVHKKGIERNGDLPVLLYGYGGFNISLTPTFDIRTAAWLDMGGVYAQPNLRGGGEYGEDWHIAGTQFQKQNVFDDFIAAAEYLISENYTSPSKIAILGGSNGGLLVGACLIQRPDLFRVALPLVGVLDMLRYHKFTAGAGWIPDYGCADSSTQMFEYLKGYSPVHNVKAGIEYPAVLIATADHDDRVVPAHSFKFAASLQHYNPDSTNPLLIRIETRAGHGAGKPTSMVIDELADIISFTWYNMGLKPEINQ